MEIVYLSFNCDSIGNVIKSVPTPPAKSFGFLFRKGWLLRSFEILNQLPIWLTTQLDHALAVFHHSFCLAWWRWDSLLQATVICAAKNTRLERTLKRKIWHYCNNNRKPETSLIFKSPLKDRASDLYHYPFQMQLSFKMFREDAPVLSGVWLNAWMKFFFTNFNILQNGFLFTKLICTKQSHSKCRKAMHSSGFLWEMRL